LKQATSVIPIVFALGSDPVADGLVASLARPGGNVTGVTQLAVEVMPKRLELAHELVPTTTVIAALVNLWAKTIRPKNGPDRMSVGAEGNTLEGTLSLPQHGAAGKSPRPRHVMTVATYLRANANSSIRRARNSPLVIGSLPA
jgi:ABC transporter substrate binding protein